MNISEQRMPSGGWTRRKARLYVHALLLVGSVVSTRAQTLETFTNTVRPADTFFAAGWSNGSGGAKSGFAQGAGVYEISGATNDSSGHVDFYVAPAGQTIDIGSNRCIGVSARALPANQSAGFRVFLIDSRGRAASAGFAASEFPASTPKALSRALTMDRGFDTKAVERVRISGNEVNGTSAFAFVFNEIAVVAKEGTFDGSVLRNFSVRGSVGTGSNVLIAGLVLQGGSAKKALLRAAGPALSAYGVGGALADPELQLHRSGGVLATNDNWTSDSTTTSAFTKAQAFPFATGSRDSALVSSINPGAYTATVKGVGDTSGEALFEYYDLDDLSTTFPEPRIINASARGSVGAGKPHLMAGFSITGTAPKTLLIRAVGPTLSGFGMTGSEPDTLLQLVNSSGSRVAENDNWESSNRAQIVSATAAAGAFPLSAGSKDSALVLTLEPGSYVALVNGSGGIALIEIYEVP